MRGGRGYIKEENSRNEKGGGKQGYLKREWMREKGGDKSKFKQR